MIEYKEDKQGFLYVPGIMDKSELGKLEDFSDCGYRIRKLTPKECWRLMAFSDEDFDKAAYIRNEYDWNDLLCNAKLKDVNEKQLQKNMGTYASCIINAFKEQVGMSTGWMKSLDWQEKERIQNVNIAMKRSEEMAHLGCATSIIKCSDFMVMLYGLTTEKDQHHHMATIGLVEKGKQNIERYMKITSEENLTPMKLSIILTVLKQIIESKIYISTIQEVNICQLTWNLIDCEKNMENLQISYLKMECIYTRVSASQLYKQAGNSIVVDVLYYIFKNLYQAMPYLFENLKVGSYFSGIGAFEKALDKLYQDINSKNFTSPQVE